MTKKLKITLIIGGVLILVALITAIIFTINTPDIVAPVERTPESEIFYGIEKSPMKAGKYYKNGDVNSYYFELTENTIEICGVDLAELNDSWQIGGADFYTDESVNKDVLQMRLDSKNEWIKEMSGTKNYSVKLTYPLEETKIVIKETKTGSGGTIYSGYTVTGENSFAGFDGAEFILVE